MDIRGSRRGPRLQHALRTLAERLALAAVAGVATALVLLWGGLAWPTARLAGAAAAVVVMVASWVSSTVPEPGPPSSRLPGPSSPPHGPEHTRPGEQRQS